MTRKLKSSHTVPELFSFNKLSDFVLFLEDPERLQTAPTGPGTRKMF